MILKPNIFISSTVKDLPNEREAAKRAVKNTCQSCYVRIYDERCR